MTQTYATLSVIYGFPAKCTITRRGASSSPEFGAIASRQFQSSASRNSPNRAETRTWEVQFKDLTSSELDALVAARDLALGAALPILWTPPPPDDAFGAIPVRFMEDEFEYEHVGGARNFNATGVFEEVI